MTHLLEVGRVPFSFMSMDVSAKSISKISSAEVVLKDASSCWAAVPVDRQEKNQQKEEIISDDPESYSAECVLNNIIYNGHYYVIMITAYALTLTYYFYIYMWLHTTQ